MLVNDQLFASLDEDLHLVRIAGGNETEVYATDDQRYVVKVKGAGGGSLAVALAEAETLRDAAQGISAAVGPRHSIPTYIIVAKNSMGQSQPVVLQPYYRRARALFDVDFHQLDRAERLQVARQILHLIGRALFNYIRHGWMPDLYGRTSTSKAERKRLNSWLMFPYRVWGFLVQRNLLRSHNLMLTSESPHRIILVDYDPMHHGKLYMFVYYQVRLLLFVRDILLILWTTIAIKEKTT